MIDFDKFVYEEMGCPDENIIEGLKNMLTYLINVRDGPEKQEKILINRELKLFNNDYEVIPQKIMEKFEKKKE